MSWGGAAAPALYAAGAALLLFAARRALRPLVISRRAALALAALPLLFVGPALFTGRIYAPFNLSYSTEPLSTLAPAYGLDDTERYPRRGILTDVNSQMLPWAAAVRRAWRLGEWPLWNPFMLAGDPLAGSAQSAPYDPLHLWSLLLPLAASWTPAAGLRFLLNALGMFALLRRFGCRESVAGLGAAAWTFSSFCAFWHAWPLGATLGLLPLLVEAVERLVARPGRRAALFLAGALILAVLAGHPENLVLLVAVGGAWGAARLASRRAAGWRPRRRVIAWAALAGLVALGATAGFLLPFVDVLTQTATWTERGAGGGLHGSVEWAAAGRAMVAVLVPPIDRHQQEGLTTSAWLGHHHLSGYAGSLLWVPAVLAFRLGARRGGARRDTVWMCVAAGLVGLCLAARLPLVTEAVGFLPLIGRTLTERLVALVPFALSVLGALGLETWLASKRSASWRRAHGGCLAAALVVAALIATRPPAGQPDLGRSLLAAALALVPLAVATLAAVRLGERPRLAFAVFAGLFLSQRVVEMARFYPTLPAAAFFPTPAILAALPDPNGPETFRVVGANWALLPNTSAHWSLEDPRGYQPTKHHRFAAIEPLWSKPQRAWFARVDDLRSPWLALLNVRYAVTGWAAPPRGWRQVARSDPRGARLLESSRALARAFLPRRLRFVAPGQRGEALAEMAATRDFADLAWIERADGSAPRREARNTKGRVTVERRGSGYRLATRLNRPGWVVVSVTHWRGWRAIDTSTGRGLAPGFANHAFLALPVEGGRRTIELRYVPAAVPLGLLVSAATLLAAAVLLPGRFFWSQASTSSG